MKELLNVLPLESKAFNIKSFSISVKVKGIGVFLKPETINLFFLVFKSEQNLQPVFFSVISLNVMFKSYPASFPE